jgi:hypothetical protein
MPHAAFVVISLFAVSAASGGLHEPLPSRGAVLTAIQEGAAAAAASLQPASEIEGGGLVAKCDYHLLRGEWYDYERLWHTGQTIRALVSASEVLKKSSLTATAMEAGRWWKNQRIQTPLALAGLMNSTDLLPSFVGCITDACNGTQDLGDVSDSAYGIFALTASTGDSSFADAASASALWQLQHMGVAGRPGLYWNILNKSAEPPSPLKDISQPFRTQIEGSLFLQAFKHTGDPRLHDGFIAQAEATVAYQDEHGLWMLWTPNDNSTGYLHLRYNLWYAHSLVDAYELTQNETYLTAAARTALFYVSTVQRSDGTMYYETNVDGSVIENDICGSAVGFLLHLVLRLLQTRAIAAHQPPATLAALRLAVTRSVAWLLSNQYPPDNADPSLAGAFLELDFRHKATYLGPHSRAVIHRDLGTSFALPALGAYDAFCRTMSDAASRRLCGAGY